MKNLLTMLLILVTSISFGQDLQLDHSHIESAPFSVGDTITIKFSTLDVNSSVPTLVQFDYQYNNKLLEKIDHTFKLDNNPNAMTSLNHWDGYSWTPIGGINPSNLSNQYQQGAYGTNTDWSVERITVQDGISIGHAQTILEVRFRVKDKLNTGYNDYSQSTSLNWANVKDNSTDTTYSVWAMTKNVDLGDVGGGTLNAVTIKFLSPVTNKSEYSYYINQISNNGSATITGNFDAAGEALISGLIDGTQYSVFVQGPGDYQTGTFPAWLDDVVTISDVYLVFNYMSSTDIDGNGTGTFDYWLQKMFANVKWDQTSEVWDATVNDEDSYIFLSYLAGTLPDYDFTVNTADNFYSITSTKYGGMNYSMLSSKYGKETIISDPSAFVPSPSETVFTLAHGFVGDVDLSHSYTPVTSGFGESAKNSNNSKVRNISFQKVPETSNLDINTQLVDGKVIMEINTTKTGMAGAQFNLTYDSNILEFSEVIFDTGNEMTNFANHNGSKLFIGSLDLNGEKTVKTGTPYKVIFTPKQSITNTAGLVSFGIKEGVKTDGTKVKFNIQ
jgi:hypothetical protein